MAIRFMMGFKFGWVKIVSLGFSQNELPGSGAEGGCRQTAVWRTEGHTCLLVIPRPQVCFCYLHPITDLGSAVPSLQFWEGGDQRFAPFCASMETRTLRAPFPAFCCLSASRSARFLRAEIRFSLSVPLTHFWLFEGAAGLPGGCGSAWGEHGRAVELSGRNGSGAPKTCGEEGGFRGAAPLGLLPCVWSHVFLS